jgi:hypothetical protein
MLSEHRRDLRVELSDALIEGQEAAGDLRDDALGDVLAGQEASTPLTAQLHDR